MSTLSSFRHGRGRKPTWDLATGRQMWDRGVSGKHIAKWAGITENALYAWARHHDWPKRQPALNRRYVERGSPNSVTLTRARPQFHHNDVDPAIQLYRAENAANAARRKSESDAAIEYARKILDISP